MRTSFLIGSFLVIGVWGTAVPANAQENPFDTTVDARMGRRVFRAECGRCHGRDAKGNDETGAPDLTAGRFTTASTDAGLFEVIRDGIPGTTMVGISWAPEPAIWQIVAYINSLSNPPGRLRSTGTRRERSANIQRQGEIARAATWWGGSGHVQLSFRSEKR